MGNSDDLPGSESDQVVERDETYEHDNFGLVEVIGIWRGIHHVDSSNSSSWGIRHQSSPCKTHQSGYDY